MSIQFAEDRAMPFEVAPQVETRLVGRPHCGQIRLPVVKGLRLAERLALRDVDETDQIFNATAELALKIADENKNQEAGLILNMLSRILAEGLGAKINLTEAEGSLRATYFQQIRELSRWNMENDERRAVRAATVLIQSRVEGQAGWTEDDTRRLHEDLIHDLYGFYLSEELKLSEPWDEAKMMEKLNEALGKLQVEPGTLPPMNPTGPDTSGSASEPTQETHASPQTSSPSSPSRSSSRRLKKRAEPSESDSSETSSPLPS